MPCCGTNGMNSLSFVVHSTERSPVVDGDTAVVTVPAQAWERRVEGQIPETPGPFSSFAISFVFTDISLLRLL